MSARPIRWTRRAMRRLDQIGAHIAADSPASAARVIARLAAAVDALSEHPAMGRPGRLPQTRELVLADIPYIVAYRVNGAAIEILTILHASQRWPAEL